VVSLEEMGFSAPVRGRAGRTLMASIAYSTGGEKREREKEISEELEKKGEARASR